MNNFYHEVYALVAQIPVGKVMTYGQIAVLLGRPTAARAVGYALHQLPPGSQIPWQRVINAQGKISPRSAADVLHEPLLQRMLLEQEGIVFDAQGRLDLDRYLWEPAEANGVAYLRESSQEDSLD
ncbi:methylated-DNA--[protein]-cysteine S-methyltransferase [candidate division KSB3 bacterium]|uniref:Methylated-DNA--[protein]-cysteine S-methyltransferase n=1 Tax=candidate division KSB3 bacterium TaxID=2044937 RepID=A0A9D5Q5Y1_9BACT|nr:methylated-DNA--[protein]-cysteine S-methyltransferase [candidate division KSB3 bacterium]MBD3324331.1 methylated-DNA--[protein]-cysteine S-methyltransferase [candidate division KSB3 bacterium]